jgi:hypothetical protein
VPPIRVRSAIGVGADRQGSSTTIRETGPDTVRGARPSSYANRLASANPVAL